eukprot:11198552-Ditylum_brightwellii.AAC.1
MALHIRVVTHHGEYCLQTLTFGEKQQNNKLERGDATSTAAMTTAKKDYNDDNSQDSSNCGTYVMSNDDAQSRIKFFQ